MSRVSIGLDYQGEPAYMSELGAEWYLLYKQYMKRQYPDIDLAVVQAWGNGSRSGATHRYGYALDYDTYRLTPDQQMIVVRTSRKFGASATFVRDDRDGFDPHIHSALDSGGGVEDGCYWQIRSVKHGRNALTNDRADRYAYLNPEHWVTAQEGIQMLKNELEATMPLTYEEMAKTGDLAAQNTWSATFGRRTAGQMLREAADIESTADRAAQHTWGATFGERTAGQMLAQAGVVVPERIQALEDKLDAVIARLDTLTAK